MFHLDIHGCCVSTGSACMAGSLKSSHVLRAMNVPEKLQNGAIRFSLGYTHTESDIDRLLETLIPTVRKLRGLI